MWVSATWILRIGDSPPITVCSRLQGPFEIFHDTQCFKSTPGHPGLIPGPGVQNEGKSQLLLEAGPEWGMPRKLRECLGPREEGARRSRGGGWEFCSWHPMPLWECAVPPTPAGTQVGMTGAGATPSHLWEGNLYTE